MVVSTRRWSRWRGRSVEPVRAGRRDRASDRVGWVPVGHVRHQRERLPGGRLRQSPLLVDRHRAPQWLRAGLVDRGSCGGYTTFSTFAQETFDLVQERDVAIAVAAVAANVSCWASWPSWSARVSAGSFDPRSRRRARCARRRCVIRLAAQLVSESASQAAAAAGTTPGQSTYASSGA